MEAYDLAHKLAYAGRRSPVPFTTGPEYTNSVPGVPVLSMLRVFVMAEDWSFENVLIVAREVSRVLGSMEQFDVGITLAKHAFGPNAPAAGVTARLMKLDSHGREVFLRVREGIAGDKVYVARFPRLEFEFKGRDYWQSVFAPGAVTPTSMV
jgi:hypothetical protein